MKGKIEGPILIKSPQFLNLWKEMLEKEGPSFVKKALGKNWKWGNWTKFLPWESSQRGLIWGKTKPKGDHLPWKFNNKKGLPWKLNRFWLGNFLNYPKKGLKN